MPAGGRRSGKRLGQVTVVRRAASGSEGFTLIEVLIAMLVLTFGVAATIGVFTSSKGLSLLAQRHEVAVHQAQKEMEYLRSLGYHQLALTDRPDIANRLESNSTRVGYHNDSATTDASSFVVRSAVGATPAVTEQLVLPDRSPSGVVDPDPTTFNVGGSGISGKVYRYVTWRPENCGNDTTGAPICPGSRNTKRVTVAVTIDSGGRQGLTKPVWMSSVVVDPEAEPYSIDDDS